MRSLADDLRRRDDEELSEFIRQRADAVNPIPADMSELASQASAAASVRNAIEKPAGPELRGHIALAVAAQPASAAGEHSKRHCRQCVGQDSDANWPF